MERVEEARALPSYRLWLRFSDGVEGVVDLSHLVGTGVFSAWEDPAQFEAVEVAEFGAPEWPGGIDLCPDSLYMQVTGKNLEEIQEDSRAALSA